MTSEFKTASVLFFCSGEGLNCSGFSMSGGIVIRGQKV